MFIQETWKKKREIDSSLNKRVYSKFGAYSDQADMGKL